MAGLYVSYPSATSTGSVTSVLIGFGMGALDGQAATVNGFSLSSTSIFMQSATATLPGVVNSSTQTFGGTKTFNSPVLHADGTLAAPGLSFSNETNTGWLRNGALNPQLSIGGLLAVDALNVGSNTNFGFGQSASSSPGAFFQASGHYSGVGFFNYTNLSNNAASGTVFQIGNGPSANFTLIENWANLSAGYLSGGSLIGANGNQTQLNIAAEFANAYIAVNVGGRTLATERLRINSTNFTLNGGMNFLVTGTSSTGIATTIIGAASGTAYSLTLPTAQGSSSSTFMKNDGVGNLSFSKVNLTSDVTGNLPISQTSGSVSLVNQVVGNLPLSQTSGSISLTLQVSGILPVANSQTLNALVGSVSLTNQVVNNLPLSQTSGSVTFTQMQTMPQFTIGSVTYTSSTGGAAYTVRWPGAVGSGSTHLQNDGLGNLSFRPLKAPTVQTFSSASGTYTTAAGALYIRVRMVGGGSGGAGGGVQTTAGNGTAGGNTTFSTSTASYLTASGALGAAQGASLGAVGGTFTNSSGLTGTFLSGGSGQGVGGEGGSINDTTAGGQGGSSYFGGAGGGGTSGGAGSNAAANSGSGGGGGGVGSSGASVCNAGAGGGSGAYGEVIIPNPAATYGYSVGTGGASGGGAGTAGSAGGAGATGFIEVTEYYN